MIEYYITTQYSNPKYLFQVFSGNTDTDTVVSNILYPHPKARYVKIVAQAWNKHIAVRAELYGCAQ